MWTSLGPLFCLPLFLSGFLYPDLYQISRTYLFICISLLLPFINFSRAGSVSVSSLNCQYYQSTWCTYNRVLSVCSNRTVWAPWFYLWTNLRTRELWLLQQSRENSKTLLSVDFHKAIKCQAQKTCVCNKNALLLPSLIKASSDTGHEHETK